MKVQVKAGKPEASSADLVCVGLFQGAKLPQPLAGMPGAADAKGGFKKITLLHGDAPARLLVVGLGKKGEFDAERARVAAALAAKQARSVSAKTVDWVPPDAEGAEETAAALVEGTALGAYSFDRSTDKEDEPPKIKTLTLLGNANLKGAAEAALVGAEAANRARELQNLPSNEATPSFLAKRAKAIAKAHPKVTVRVMDRKQIAAKKMGGLVAVSQGTAQEPRLITLRYSAGGNKDWLGLVGKAVTFDSGGISIKPSQGMQEMKMDMSGGAAVIEAVAAIAELKLPVNVIAVVPSTENMPSGTAVKPGDIIKQYNGKTVEVNNTDAEGRLILADALAYCVEQGADRIVDLATLTGAVLVALGSTYCALISNDDRFAKQVEGAATETGELAWRLPLHPEYKKITKGSIADLTNASESRKAGTIYAGSFLEEFVDETPWVHLDIAGTAWDFDREYAPKGPTGFGVRLLVELAKELA